MKSYVTVTGVMFGLLAVVHVWRVLEEGMHVLTNPWWVVMTAAAAGLCLWAGRLLWLDR